MTLYQRCLVTFGSGSYITTVIIDMNERNILTEEINVYTIFLCQKDIGDEFHYILSCEYFQRERPNYIKPYYRRHPNTLKFKQLMNSTNSIELKKLCKFIQDINKGILAR